jgi:hypothetical protein
MNAAALLLMGVVFAFSDEQGVRLLATSEVANPHMLNAALCTGAPRPLAIEFDRTQAEGQDSTGRQNPQNFDRTGGSVFRIVGAKVSGGSTCVVTEQAFLADATLVTLQRPPDSARCSKATYPQLQKDKGRPVLGCWPIGESPAGDRSIAVLEFSRHLTRALASIIVRDGDRRIYVDFPAIFTGPGDDLWRADDGGSIHPEGFQVVFLMKRGNTYLVGLDWAGAEGSVLSIHVADGPGDSIQFQEVMSDSWYRSPL